MMRSKSSSLAQWPMIAAASLLVLPMASAFAQSAPASPAATKPAPASAAKPTAAAPDRASSYYHLALAKIYEDEAVSTSRPEFVTKAIDEYKLALVADPGSAQLNGALAELYFRVGRPHDAEASARILLKIEPNDLDAHRLLGRIYLRQLGEDQNAVSSTSPSGNVLELAIAEFEKIVVLAPKSVEDHIVLGQLDLVKHDAKKAEEQFKIAVSIEPDSEDAVLSLARLYGSNGDLSGAVKVIEAVPVADRSPKLELALGAAYDQLKQPKDAVAAYQRATDMEPGESRIVAALAQALLNDNQLDEALKQYKQLATADADDTTALIHICEIQRRQRKYQEALATIRKARKIEPNSLEVGYNEGLLLDVLGRLDEATVVYEKMVDLASHANGAYTTEEKNNRGIFLERLGTVYQEQNKIDLALATYQKLIEMGGESATRGYEGQVESYNDAKNFAKAAEVSRKAVESAPKDLDLKLMLAGSLIELGKSDEALSLAKGLLGSAETDRAIWVRLGQFYTQLRRWKEAEEAFAKATTLTSRAEDRTYLFFLKGALAERQKHYEPAEQLFHQALELDPQNAMTLNYFGYMLADKTTRLPEALTLIRKAVEEEPMNGAYLDSLGWAYFKLGQYEFAEENLTKAVERDRSDPTVHDHLGDLYEKTGRIRLAAAQWEQSLAQYAKSAAADVEPGDAAKVQKKLDAAKVKLARQESATGQVKTE